MQYLEQKARLGPAAMVPVVRAMLIDILARFAVAWSRSTFKAVKLISLPSLSFAMQASEHIINLPEMAQLRCSQHILQSAPLEPEDFMALEMRMGESDKQPGDNCLHPQSHLPAPGTTECRARLAEPAGQATKTLAQHSPVQSSKQETKHPDHPPATDTNTLPAATNAELSCTHPENTDTDCAEDDNDERDFFMNMFAPRNSHAARRGNGVWPVDRPTNQVSSAGNST